MAVFLNAGIMALPGQFVTREIPRICRGFFLGDRADQTEGMPCLPAARPPTMWRITGSTLNRSASFTSSLPASRL